jgi:CubicO group peptidase (beta-lactamase class C family)
MRISEITRKSLPWKHIRPFRAEDVTSIGAEDDPREAGLHTADLERIWRSVVRLYETGLHPGIGLAIRAHGRLILDRAIGHARGNAPEDPEDAPKTLATPRTLFNLFSASKAITAMLVHLLDERGLLHLDDPVADYIPEFAKKKKEWMTLRHILTHRAGIPNIPGVEIDLDLLADPDRILELIIDLAPRARPGRSLAYHALTGGYVLAAVLKKVVGRDIRSFLKSELRDPLGFEHLDYGVSPDRVGEVAVNAFTGTPATPPYSWILQRALGVPLKEAVRISNDPRFLTCVIPSGNIVATANEAGRYFELLRGGGQLDGVRVFEPRTIRRATAEQTYLEVDSFLSLPIRYGMGFMLGSRWWSVYGHDTERAFGHIGFTSVLGYADPDRAISVAFVTNGKPLVTPGQIPWLLVPRTIARVIKPPRH